MKKLFTTLFATASLVACVELPKTVEYDNSLAFTEVSGYPFHTLTVGEQQDSVVIVVHGGPGGDHQYLKSLSPLAEHHQVIFYDQRGSGLSPRVHSSQLTIEQNLADLNVLVEHFSANNKVKLIGHSWGGMLVSGYLSSYPEKVSHAVIVEPGMLYPGSAQVFVTIMQASQSISDIFALLRHMSIYPFVNKNDGDEGFDYAMTKMLNRNKPGSPFYCEGQSMPADTFIRGGYEVFNSMLKPVMQDPTLFTYDLTDGIKNYHGQLMMISSECSEIGYNFQQQYHQPRMPEQMVHVKAENMGHYMLTDNPEWSLEIISPFLAKR
ncbi:MAG: alpha/beta fold hydrolase [Psychromonas sp.]|nr:alpha/beta fold hydrolase [Psychromonas sp.]